MEGFFKAIENITFLRRNSPSPSCNQGLGAGAKGAHFLAPELLKI